MEGLAGAAEPNEEGEDEGGTVEHKIEDEDKEEVCREGEGRTLSAETDQVL